MDAVTQEDTDVSLDFPNLWGVKFINDDYTPVEFVIAVLMRFFNMSAVEADAVTMKVHTEGAAVVGAYTKDIAETKAHHTLQIAVANGHPLRVEAVIV